MAHLSQSSPSLSVGVAVSLLVTGVREVQLGAPLGLHVVSERQFKACPAATGAKPSEENLRSLNSPWDLRSSCQISTDARKVQFARGKSPKNSENTKSIHLCSMLCIELFSCPR